MIRALIALVCLAAILVAGSILLRDVRVSLVIEHTKDAGQVGR